MSPDISRQVVWANSIVMTRFIDYLFSDVIFYLKAQHNKYNKIKYLHV